jgi:hypothetical protein
MKYLLGATLAAVSFYLVFTYWDRAESTRRYERARRQRVAFQQAAAASESFRLVQFYVAPPVIVEGEHAIACYGVENAAAVELDPPVEEVHPVLNRCFSLSPEKTTTYRLRATGRQGEEARAEFTLTVNPAPPFISLFATSDKKIARGDFFTLCYGVEHAQVVRLEPLGLQLPPMAKNCVKTRPVVSTNYTLVAAGVEGMTSQKTVRVEVQ